MKNISLLLALLLLFSGCFAESEVKNEKETTAVCVLTNHGEESTFTATAKGDEIIKSETVTKKDLASYVEYGVAVDASQNSDQYYEGIAITYEEDGEYLTETVTIDYEVVDFEMLKDLGFINGKETISKISLKGTIEAYEVQGVECITE